MFDTGAVNEDEATNYQLINPHSYEGFPDYSNDNPDNPNNNNN